MVEVDDVLGSHGPLSSGFDDDRPLGILAAIKHREGTVSTALRSRRIGPEIDELERRRG
jgi:hypothetical protein